MSGLVNDQIDGIVCACANSVYQALFTPPAPGNEARFAQEMASLPGQYSGSGAWRQRDVPVCSLGTGLFAIGCVDRLHQT